MAKKIVWTETAVLDRLEIYRFWLLHNKSDAFSEKLEQLFNESARLIAQFPEIGTQTDFPGVRVKVIKATSCFIPTSLTQFKLSEFGILNKILINWRLYDKLHRQ